MKRAKAHAFCLYMFEQNKSNIDGECRKPNNKVEAEYK